MRTRDMQFMAFVLCAFISTFSVAATKVHVIAFGKWSSVQWFPGYGAANEKPLSLKIRALIVDGRVKEYVSGPPHDVTERLFTVRRAFRVNDSLPEDNVPHWQWQRGGWLLVDRVTGKISTLNLPEFDAFYSAVAWYRDYVAYCGVSDDGKKIYAMVAQISRRKPVLKKQAAGDGLADETVPDSACPAPVWQRNPVRVSFDTTGKGGETFAIRGHVVDTVDDSEEDEGTK